MDEYNWGKKQFELLYWEAAHHSTHIVAMSREIIGSIAVQVVP
jgi:hypothetical protein